MDVGSTLHVAGYVLIIAWCMWTRQFPMAVLKVLAFNWFLAPVRPWAAVWIVLICKVITEWPSSAGTTRKAVS